MGKRYRAGSGWVDSAVRGGLGLYSAYSQTRKRKSESSAMQGSLTLRRTRRRVGRNRRRSANQVYRQWLGRSNRVVYRWQQVSSSLLGPGRVAIQWSDQEGTEFDKVPMYFMSLSQYPYGGTAWDKENGSRDDGLKRWQYANASPGNGKWVFFPLTSQSHNGGADDPSGHWWLEQQSGRPSPESPHAYRTHAWTQIKLNLYGTLSVPAVDLTNPSWDVYRENQQENDVEWGKKVYMMITASCPERLSSASGLSVDLLSNDAIGRGIMETAGSFDILVRQCFYLTGNH